MGDKMENNYILIDIRESYEFKMGHIKDAINIPIDLLELMPERYLLKDKIYHLYCGKGIKSKELSLKLNNKGYNTSSLDKGYDEWKLGNIN